ncbi:stalk domain-containing protein [Paenibacillus sp. MBLB4367]|uniref:stalk domain-containing protein n=1 Tax=Paenibacillus sp. MBLB4367 TaxID=3384767 RepID=UPI003907EF54
MGLGAGLLLAFSSLAYASDKVEVNLFPVKVTFEGEEKQMNEDYFVFNHNGNAYLPARFVAENLKAHVQYNDETKTIEFYNMDIIVGAPLVNEDQAKLVGYETVGMKKIDSLVYRLLNKEELKLMPEQAKHLTPLYYVMEGSTQSGERVTLYVSSNEKSHYFMVGAANK